MPQHDPSSTSVSSTSLPSTSDAGSPGVLAASSGVALTDLTWGDVLSDDDGVLVVEGTITDPSGERPVIIKRYGRPEQRREITNHRLLAGLGVPTPELLGYGDDWLCMAHLPDAGYRLATPSDAADPAVARQIARWYATLHQRGIGHTEGLSCEHELVTDETLAEVASRWPELADALGRWRSHVPQLRRQASELAETITYNDFWYDNLALDDFSGEAVIFDYNLVGRGYRFSDVRNVCSGLSDEAAAAFVAEYERLTGPIDPREREVDAPLAHLAALVLAAAGFDQLPRWAEASRLWVLAHDPADD